jgi:hypothetical protein
LRFELGDVFIGGVELRANVVQDRVALRGIGFLLGQMEICFDVGNGAREFLLRGDVSFRVLALLENGLGFFLVLPERGIVNLWLKGLQQFAVGGNVKDSSARVRCASSIPRSGLASLQCAELLA